MNLLERLMEMHKPDLFKIRLEPDKDGFDALVAKTEEAYRNSNIDWPEIAEDIQRLAMAGYKAYENGDQKALEEAVKQLDTIYEKILNYPPYWIQPEQWQLCGAVMYRTQKYIEQFLCRRDRGEIPAEFCAKYLDPEQVRADIDVLNRLMRKCLTECRILKKVDCRNTCDQWNTIVDIYRRWDDLMPKHSPSTRLKDLL